MPPKLWRMLNATGHVASLLIAAVSFTNSARASEVHILSAAAMQPVFKQITPER